MVGDRHRRVTARSTRARSMHDRRAQPERPGLPRRATRTRPATRASTRSTRTSRCSRPTSRPRNDPSPVGRYREPNVLPDGRILVVVGGRPRQRPQRDRDAAGLRHLRLRPEDAARTSSSTTTARRGTLGAIAVVAAHGAAGHRRRCSTSPTRRCRSRIGSVNVRNTSLARDASTAASSTNTPLARRAQGRGRRSASSRASRAKPRRASTMFGLTMHEGAAVLGETPVYADGSWLANVPPYIPMHLQPIDKFGLVDPQPGSLDARRCPARTAAASAATRAARAKASRRSARTRRVAEQHGAEHVHRGHPGPHASIRGTTTNRTARARSSRSSMRSASPATTTPRTATARRRSTPSGSPTRSRAQRRSTRFRLRPLRPDATANARPAHHGPLRPRHLHLAGVVRLDLLPVGACR